MSTKNRGDRIQLLQKVVMKHFTPVATPEDRSVLEHLIYGCCLEDAPYDAAEDAFHRLRESFSDWNEVRVTTVAELCESLGNLPDPSAAAVRIKKNLQSLFETRYSFDIDDMTKMNQGKAVQELEKLGGMTKYVLAYLTQNALGGHSIPVSNSIMNVLVATEIVSEAEAEKGLAPGLERTVPKTKGPAFSSCLHQLAVDYALSPEEKPTKAIMKEAGANEKPAKATTTKRASKPTSASASSTSTAKEPKPSAADAGSASAAKGDATKKATPKKVASPKTTAAKSTTKKSAGKTAQRPPAKSKTKQPSAGAAAPKKVATKKAPKRKPK